MGDLMDNNATAKKNSGRRTKNLLNKSEELRLQEMGSRIDRAMQYRGFNTFKDLCEIIKNKRGDSPDRTVFYKIKYPPYVGFYNLSVVYLIVIADALGVSTDYLLGRNKKNEKRDVK